MSLNLRGLAGVFTNSTAVVEAIEVGPTTAALLCPEDKDRLFARIHNDAGTLWVKLGPDCSRTDFTYRLSLNTAVEIQGYTGIITAIKLSGTTTVYVTTF